MCLQSRLSFKAVFSVIYCPKLFVFRCTNVCTSRPVVYSKRHSVCFSIYKSANLRFQWIFFFKRFKTDIFFCVYLNFIKVLNKGVFHIRKFSFDWTKTRVVIWFCFFLKLKCDALLYDIQKGIFFFLLKSYNSSLLVIHKLYKSKRFFEI